MRLDDFDAFFAEVNDGRKPFAWQRRLCEFVAKGGAWPEEVVAPTGSGKSNVVDVHVFLNALHAAGSGPRVPRRMAVVVNRRALVDQHQVRAEHIAAMLESASDGLLREVADRLRGLCRRYDVHSTTGDAPADSPLRTVSLRGGVRPGVEWIEDPRACAVIAATPDMWGSRLLFRGYGTTRHARPREAGLLAIDSVMVLDESHLNRQLLITARDVAAATRRECQSLGVPPLHVVAASATPASQALSTVGVEAADLHEGGADGSLARRLQKPKPVQYAPTELWPSRGTGVSAGYVKHLADIAEEIRSSTAPGSPATTVGCVVNNVETAIGLAGELGRRVGREAVAVWVGRLRPMDLKRLRKNRPGLFTVDGDASVTYLVATQTVEVGVDLDLAGMMTELAPGSALAQRAGRVNRLGCRDSARVVVVGPHGEVEKERLPYSAEDLEAARQWLLEIQDTEEGLAPWALAASPPPREAPRRLAFSHLCSDEWRQLAETNEEEFVEPDLGFWLRDDLMAPTEPIGFVVRSPLPSDDAAALDLLRAAPVEEEEIFPAVRRDAESRVEAILASPERDARVFVERRGDLSLLTDPRDLRPGDVLIVDATHPLTTFGVVTGDALTEAEAIATRWTHPQELEADVGDGAASSVVVDGATNPVGERLLILVRGESREDVSEVVSAELGARMDVTLDAGFGPEQPTPAWMVLRPVKTLLEDPEVRQELTSSAAPVSLKAHASNVARLARRMGADLGLHDDVVGALDLAGLHHDAGKADLRFQRNLGGGMGPRLAKSGHRSAYARRRARLESGLPPRWRHEQLSTAMTKASVAGVDNLVLRLVGTSHGRGRPFFPHGPGGLLDDGDELLVATVNALFEAGAGWTDVWEATHHQHGVWGCAYLEAVLRSADARVSKDGS